MRDYKPSRQPLTDKGVAGKPPAKAGDKPQEERTWNLMILWPLLLFILLMILLTSTFTWAFQAIFPLQNDTNLMVVYADPGSKGNIYLIRLLPSNRAVQVYELAGTNQIELGNNYGQYQVRSIYPLLAMDKKSASYINSTFSLINGVIIDNVIVLERPLNLANRFEWLKLLASNKWQAAEKTTFGTKMSWLAFSLSRQVSWLQAKEVIAEITSKKDLLQPASDLDCSVAIINNTEARGLARKVSQVVETSGLQVIRTSSESDENQEKSQVFYDDGQEGCLRAAELLSKLLPFTATPEINSSKAKYYRSGAGLIIGKDFNR